MAKRLQSTYVPGRRTRNWLKTKHYQRETFLVGGFVPDHDQVRSLLVGLPDPGRPGGLVFCGRSTTAWCRRPGGGSGSSWGR